MSGAELNEINKMECGIGFNLYADKETYVRWVGLLEGLVMAKERGGKQWWRSRLTTRAATVTRPVAPLTVREVRAIVVTSPPPGPQIWKAQI